MGGDIDVLLSPPRFFIMGTLERFYRNARQNRLSVLTEDNEARIRSVDMESHLATSIYDGFTLTDAVRPSLDLSIIPQQGYKHEQLIPSNGRSLLRTYHPKLILAISISRDQLFDTFLELLNPLGATVSVILETSHGHSFYYRTRFRRDDIDLPVLKSFLYDHEALLLHDGCTGMTVVDSSSGAWVRFDDHKLILVRAKSFLPFETVLQCNGILRNESMKLLTDAEHIHITRDEYFQRFQTLQRTLGIDERYTAAR